LILAEDLEYGDISEISQLLEEVSKLVEAYSQALLNEIDAHAMRLDDRGNGFLAWGTEGRVLGVQDLAGEGMIAGFSVRCMTPEMQMVCHTGYELPDAQYRDLELLHTRLGVEYPDEATGQRISGHAAAGDHALEPQA
jgi:hypothetical protein